jgi:hypothetical protein
MPYDRALPTKGAGGCNNLARGSYAMKSAKRPGLEPMEGGPAHGAWPHGPPYDQKRGRAGNWGLAPNIFYKVGFL